MEDIVRTRSDAEDQPPGTAYLTGFTGGNGIVLAGGDTNGPVFAKLLKEMYEAGRREGITGGNGDGADDGDGSVSDPADDQPLIMAYRMGDEFWSKNVVDRYAEELLEELSLTPAPQDIVGRRRVQIRGSLHYGNNCHNGLYSWTPQSEAANLQMLSFFVEKLEKGGVDVQ